MLKLAIAQTASIFNAIITTIRLLIYQFSYYATNSLYSSLGINSTLWGYRVWARGYPLGLLQGSSKIERTS